MSVNKKLSNFAAAKNSLDSFRPRPCPEGEGEAFFLDILFHNAWLRKLLRLPCIAEEGCAGAVHHGNVESGGMAASGTSTEPTRSLLRSCTPIRRKYAPLAGASIF